ncbi:MULTISPECIES: NDP-sugar synthase [Thermococcus]|uniref:Bifunctional protein GlmU n=1 Tax=Thermococcus nautili TaxID=195522 RepID=W8NR20_9EURY|nr:MULTISPECIES: NDP-sugar synthase [Thermococcus]AHL21658.1 Nucleoside-diphosphate-sugar pyrophosphorylase involved in lipopolysaccharide biosynthesis/translation initiation factor 2B, gamma/epsilon subunits (eIF-2Bgamma/eIF-2Bepsilon) [Thermococcus nautili]NJE49090.1 NDP-sugar synthase [Thermococcus sp. 9N3]
MKAVILAGGKGTRLLPLTVYRPKPMIPFFNRPLMEYALQSLIEAGVDEVYVLVGYLKERIIDYFGDGSEWGIEIHYSNKDNVKLGTAGATKKVVKHMDDTFLVVSSDVLTNLDLRALYEYHKKKKALATIALSEVDDPTQYGIAIIDEDGRIQQFKEKPRPEEVFSNLVNAGIYVFEPEAFDHVPKNKNFDFSRDLFPRMLENDLPLYGFPFKEYWNDVGRPSSYLQATEDVFLGRLILPQVKTESLKGNLEYGGALYTGRRCVLRKPEIRGFAVIGDDVEIGRNVKIERSVIFSGVTIEDGAEIKEAIIGENVHIGKGVVIQPGSVIGDNTLIEDFSKIGSNVKIWVESRIGRESIILPD